jgi:outer membrane lipase/esterase
LEHTPHFRGLPQKFQEETVRVTTEHNRLLRLDLREYKRKHENVEIFFFDLKGFMESIIKNGAALGFKDVIHACYNEETGAICSNPDDYLFWDHIHPTTKGHALLMKGVLETTIPINDADSSSNGDGNKKGSNAGNKGELY